jgi:LmbE family N-acetylglucosaminyl deacetylase
MKIYLIILGILVLIFLGLTLISYSGILFRSRASVKDPEKAKANGDDLLNKQHRVLAVAAHPDDLEYWSAGTLGLLAKNGSDVLAVICTTNQKNGDIRKKEQEKAAEIMGYKKVLFLDLPDRYLAENQDALKIKLLEVFKKERPDVVFTFDAEHEGLVYHHSDHETAGRITESVSKDEKVNHIYFFHTSAPDTLFNISSIIDKKIEALDAHQSQAQWFYRKNFRDWQLKRMLHTYGLMISVSYAEPFRKGW